MAEEDRTSHFLKDDRETLIRLDENVKQIQRGMKSIEDVCKQVPILESKVSTHLAWHEKREEKNNATNEKQKDRSSSLFGFKITAVATICAVAIRELIDWIFGRLPR